MADVGHAQVVFQLAIAAPVFWTSTHWISAERLDRILLLVFGANFLGAAVGLLQVYYPATFMPPEFSRLALSLNADVVGALTYIGADGREIIRPPGLSDIPAGAAVSATVSALLGFAFATRAQATHGCDYLSRVSDDRHHCRVPHARCARCLSCSSSE